jgi:hypothetical protein
MFDLFRRYSQRQRDLAAGADADLVQSNRKKWRSFWWLFGLFLLLEGIEKVVKPHGLVQEIFRWLIPTSLAFCMLLGLWARVESGFLREPDPKKPPSLFK